MAEEYEAQGDAWDMPTGVMPVGKERIIRAAASGDVPEVRRLISLGALKAKLTSAARRSDR